MGRLVTRGRGRGRHRLPGQPGGGRGDRHGAGGRRRHGRPAAAAPAMTPAAPASARGLARRELGRSGLAVTELGLGSAALGNLLHRGRRRHRGGHGRRGVAGGIRLFDMAPHYGLGPGRAPARARRCAAGRATSTSSRPRSAACWSRRPSRTAGMPRGSRSRPPMSAGSTTAPTACARARGQPGPARPGPDRRRADPRSGRPRGAGLRARLPGAGAAAGRGRRARDRRRHEPDRDADPVRHRHRRRRRPARGPVHAARPPGRGRRCCPPPAPAG